MGFLEDARFGDIRLVHNNLLTEVMRTREGEPRPAYLLPQCRCALSREVFARVFWEGTTWRSLKKVLVRLKIPAGTFILYSTSYLQL